MAITKLDEKTKSLNQSDASLQMHVANLLEPRWDTSLKYQVRVSPFLDPISKHLPSSTCSTNFDPSIFANATRQSMDKNNVKKTSIDIAAWKNVHFIGEFNLCIELKEPHPDYVDWVFSQKSTQDDFRCLIRKRLRNYTPVADLLKTFDIKGRSDTLLGIQTISQDYFDHPRCDFGMSLKKGDIDGKYSKSDKTKIDQVARQTIEGTYGFTVDRTIQDIRDGEPALSKQVSQLFIPIIVTNANLFIDEFDKEKIDSETGKITENPNYKPVDSLIYESPVPKTIQFPEQLERQASSAQNAAITKWHVLVFTARGFSEFLGSIRLKDVHLMQCAGSLTAL